MMRLQLLALAGLVLVSAGCRSHVHAGGGQGLDAGASVDPPRAHYASPPRPVVERIPPPDLPLPAPSR